VRFFSLFVSIDEHLFRFNGSTGFSVVVDVRLIIKSFVDGFDGNLN